ncbi:DedA family protein [Leucobacter sp. gxy201]|uniref:DedA family protein n=1 Tax=Leucobacter sp. gxy201 TaxID=2957200 RepID=UPI003DA18589
MTEVLQTLIEFVRDLDPLLRTLVAGIGMMLETSIFIGLIIPGDTIALVSAVGVQGPLEFALLVVALVLGAIAGESIGFAIGRWLGPKIRTSRLGRRLGDRNWQMADRYLGRRGGFAVFLSRFLPVFHSLIPLSAGMIGMSYRRFLAWTSSASVIWAVLVVGLGSGAAAGYEQLARHVKGAGYVFVAAALVVVGGVWLVKRLLLRLERVHLIADDTGQRESRGEAGDPTP